MFLPQMHKSWSAAVHGGKILFNQQQVLPASLKPGILHSSTRQINMQNIGIIKNKFQDLFIKKEFFNILLHSL